MEAPLTIIATTPGHQKQWKRGFHVCIGARMTGECIREGQRQLRLKAVVRGMVICLRWQKVVVARQVGERAEC
eukprot:scaffold11223_cov57-Attheya_sp.AAC.2